MKPTSSRGQTSTRKQTNRKTELATSKVNELEYQLQY